MQVIRALPFTRPLGIWARSPEHDPRPLEPHKHVSCRFRNFFATLVFWSGCCRGKTPVNRHNALVAQWIEHRFPKRAGRVPERGRSRVNQGNPGRWQARRFECEPAVSRSFSNFLATCARGWRHGLVLSGELREPDYRGLDVGGEEAAELGQSVAPTALASRPPSDDATSPRE